MTSLSQQAARKAAQKKSTSFEKTRLFEVISKHHAARQNGMGIAHTSKQYVTGNGPIATELGFMIEAFKELMPVSQPNLAAIQTLEEIRQEFTYKFSENPELQFHATLLLQKILQQLQGDEILIPEQLEQFNFGNPKSGFYKHFNDLGRELLSLVLVFEMNKAVKPVRCVFQINLTQEKSLCSFTGLFYHEGETRWVEFVDPDMKFEFGMFDDFLPEMSAEWENLIIKMKQDQEELEKCFDFDEKINQFDNDILAIFNNISNACAGSPAYGMLGGEFIKQHPMLRGGSKDDSFYYRRVGIRVPLKQEMVFSLKMQETNVEIVAHAVLHEAGYTRLHFVIVPKVETLAFGVERNAIPRDIQRAICKSIRNHLNSFRRFTGT